MLRAPFIFRRLLLGAGLISLLGLRLWAFPPAPFHRIYGLIRDEYGNPMTTASVEIILETQPGTLIKTTINSSLEPGVNYRLDIPMDSGLTSELYRPTALLPSVPFKIKVKIGQITYLPIEMTGDFSKLGQPGKRTLLNLTLGEDLNGDGLPDAWQRMVNPDISKVNPGDDSDGDGLSNLQEYLAGTYAFDPKDGFRLSISGTNNGKPLMKFMAITGRSYTLLGSIDLEVWAAVTFRIPAQDAADTARQFYQSSDVRMIEIEAIANTAEPPPVFFKLMLK